MINALISAFRRLAGRPKPLAARLLTPDQTGPALAAARAAADRTGQPLSVVVFTPGAPGREAATWEVLAGVLAGRLRIVEGQGGSGVVEHELRLRDQFGAHVGAEPIEIPHDEGRARQQKHGRARDHEHRGELLADREALQHQRSLT